MPKIIELSSTPLNLFIKDYHLYYDNGIKKIFQKKVLKQLLKLWSETKQFLLIYRQFNINLNPIMEKITKIFFFVYKTNKQVINERKEYLKHHRTKIKKLQKLRTKKLLYKS